MFEDKKILFADETCVGILRVNNAYQVHVLSPEVLSSLEKTYDRVELVHLRCFSELLPALGYKEILRELSTTSLKALIKKDNPTQGDLKTNYCKENDKKG